MMYHVPAESREVCKRNKLMLRVEQDKPLQQELLNVLKN